jgi:quercetin dioxygenase-like cupin family protein
MASAEAPASPRALVPLLSSSQTIVGETLNYPSGAPARITAATLTLPPGAETGWHTHGVPTFGYMLDGELTVDYGEKGKRIYRAGDALLEAIQVAHNGRNTGSGPMRILAVFMGAEGLSNSVPVGR